MLIPSFFIASVVALGGIHTVQIPGQPDRQEWQTEGTGFFYGCRLGSDADGKPTYELYLVTAGHVVKDHIAAGLGDVQVRINPKPEAMAIEGTKAHPKAALVGIVRGYFPYTEIAISTQTRQTRIVFQENSGLAEVLPLDYVNEAIVAWKAQVSVVPVAPAVPAPH